MKQGIHSHFPFPLCYHWSQDDVFAKYGKTEKKKRGMTLATKQQLRCSSNLLHKNGVTTTIENTKTKLELKLTLESYSTVIL